MSKRSIFILRVFFGAAAIFFMGFIFYNSSLTAGKSAKLSGKVLEFIKKFLPKKSISFNQEGTEDIEKISAMHGKIRKLAHFSEFFGLSASVLCFLLTFNRFKTVVSGVLSFYFSAMFAMTDELHQQFVAGRSMSIKDVFIDWAGSILAILVVSFIIFAKKTVFRDRKKKKCY